MVYRGPSVGGDATPDELDDFFDGLLASAKENGVKHVSRRFFDHTKGVQNVAFGVDDYPLWKIQCRVSTNKLIFEHLLTQKESSVRCRRNSRGIFIPHGRSETLHTLRVYERGGEGEHLYRE